MRFKVGDRVRKNRKYVDRSSFRGMEFLVVATGTIGDIDVIWTEPSLGGAYAADGFDLVEKCSEVGRGSSQLL